MSLSEMFFHADAGLGCASTVLQVHLGVGLVLMYVSSAVRTGKPMGKVLEGTCWQLALRRAAQAAASAPALAAHALLQAHGSAMDQLSWLGLTLASAAVVLGAASAVLGPMMGAGANGNATNGINTNGVNGNHDAVPAKPKPQKTSALSRISSALLGSALSLLVFGNLPSGAQLRSAAALVRLALLVRAAGAFTHAVSPKDSNAALLVDLEKIIDLAPLVSCLALFDYSSAGASSVAAALFQPAVYCALLGLAQALAVLLPRALLGAAPPADAPAAGLDLSFSLDTKAHGGPQCPPALERVLRLAQAAFYTAAAVAVGCALGTSFNVAVSATGFSVAWGGSPLLGAACLLQALIVGVFAAEFLSVASSAKKDAPNGKEAAGPGLAAYLKAVVAPAQAVVLALLLSSRVQMVGKLSFMALPRYGLVAAAAGVTMQVALLLLFAVAHANDYPPKEPPVDCTGTLEEGGLVRALALCLLQGGLALGIAGLGFVGWLAAGAVCGPVIYLVLPKAARHGISSALGALVSTLLAQLGDTFSVVGDMLEKQRVAREARRAKQAAEKAALLLEEEGAEKRGRAQDKKKRDDKIVQKKEEKPQVAAPEETVQQAEESGPPKKKKGVGGAPKKKK
mmetsp:Transcript_93474/g.243465  ORF Transcript_93474/g.243465 Transcript_93474/m.243465 type:complete len:625 (+) Transcript_93474:147-2021(+)